MDKEMKKKREREGDRPKQRHGRKEKNVGEKQDNHFMKFYFFMRQIFLDSK